MTAAPASADGLVKEAGQALPTEVDQAVNGDPAERISFQILSIGLSGEQSRATPETQKPRRSAVPGRWARRVSNLRPLACEASALPLSYAPYRPQRSPSPTVAAPPSGTYAAPMSELRLILMPYELGRLREGVGRGPERLLECGADRALGAHGGRVRTELLEFTGTYSSEINSSFDLIGQVSASVASAVREGAFPVVLSGSCFAAVGVVAGLGEAAPGVVWFDAHGDFNTPDSTVFGYFDGMGLAILTGGAWRAMRAEVPGAGPVPETAVVLAGARDFDEGEEERLDDSQITRVPPQVLNTPDALVEAVERVGASGIYLQSTSTSTCSTPRRPR